MKCSGHWKLLCEFSKLLKLNALTGFNMYAEYTRPQLTFLALVPWNNVGFMHVSPSYVLISLEFSF